jgi:IS30 family transposase
VPEDHGADTPDLQLRKPDGPLLAPSEVSVKDQPRSISAKHAEITLATKMDIYFCDPHSPWQRGSNENTNGLLRQYFPKGTDLSVHSPVRLLEVATELNARPRKTLGGITPAKAMQRLLFDPERPIVATTA